MIQLVPYTKRREYKNLVKSMWGHCFPMDSSKFVDFYFDKIYKEEETLILTKGSKPVASMQMIPYFLLAKDKVYTGGYISGLMTLPNYRNRGYMKRLLSASFDVMQEKKGYDYTFLIPQERKLVCMYEKFGYQMISNVPFHCSEADSSQQNISCKVFSSLHSVGMEWYSVYSRFLIEQPYVVFKTAEKFNHMLWSFFYEKGNLFASEDGLAFTFGEKAKVVIKEFFYRNESVKNYFLTTIKRFYRQKNIVFASYPILMIKKLYPSTQSVIPHLYVNMMLD